MKMLKGILLVFAMVVAFASNAQQRVKVSDGLYLVSYGNTAVIEDEINQKSISIEVAQDGIDRATGEKMYNVVCGKWTRRTVKDGVNTAVAAGIAAAAATNGASLIASAAVKFAGYIYDDLCDYYGSDF